MALQRTIVVQVENGDGAHDDISLSRTPGHFLELRLGARGKLLQLSDEEVVELIDALRELQVSS